MNTLEQQALIVIRALEGRKIERSSPIYKKALEWIDRWPQSIDEKLKKKLIEAFKGAFDVSEAQIYAALQGHELAAKRRPLDEEGQLRAQLPSGGWMETYAEFTAYNEAPLSFHLFCALGLVGMALQRRCSMPMGHFNIYPPYNVILVGPTGRVRKTTAIDIARWFVREASLCPIMADKITPEAVVSALKESSQQFIYAPEFSVFFGKQRYNEGLVTMVLRLLDYPAEWTARTESRGSEELINPTVHIMGGSTLSLLSTSAPAEVTSSGFLNRFVVVVENGTDRCFSTPRIGAGRDKILARLRELKLFQGEIGLSKVANSWFDRWYRQTRANLPESDTEAEVVERMHVHLRRTAMNLHLVECGLSDVCLECLETSWSLLQYVIKKIPYAVRALERIPAKQDSDQIMEMILKLGGATDHSTLLRRVAVRGINSKQLRQHVQDLEEQGKIKISKKGIATFYVAQES